MARYSRYQLYKQARDREHAYARAAFWHSVHTGLEGTDDTLHELGAATAAAWVHMLRGNPCAAAVHAARRWWAREEDAERERLTWQLRASDDRWHGLILHWFEAGCPDGGTHPAAVAGRDLEQRTNAALAAWDADWRAALLALERAHTTRRTQNAVLAEAA